MKKLFLTTCFHGNLGYSSIPESRISEVIDKCYWPIVSIAEELSIPLGFEFPAKTLECIQANDKELIKKIRMLSKEKKIEIIGSSYVQSIFPLIPAQINKKNLEIGNAVYEKILGNIPDIAFVNEQCFSAGLISLYKEAGYKAIIIDWINANKHNDLPKNSLYKSAIVKGIEDNISVVWNDSITFQRFQRYVYGDIDKNEYLKEILSHYSADETRSLMIYGNDMEVFNFRARNPKTLHSGDIQSDEIKKIKDLFQILSQAPNIQFVLPGDTLKSRLKYEITIHTAQYPILTKKQDKYNVCRWAVCGNNNWKSNTLCYRAYHLFKEIGKSQLNAFDDLPWKSLVALWASDFRSHTEAIKYKEFRKAIDSLIKRTSAMLSKIYPKGPNQSIRDTDWIGTYRLDQDNNTIETDKILLSINARKGGTIDVLIFKDVGQNPFIKLLRHGYYDDISYGVDFFSGHTIIFDRQKKITDLSPVGIVYRKSSKGYVAEVKGHIGQHSYLKKYLVRGEEPQVDVDLEFDFKNGISPSVFRTFILTLNPDCFDRKSLYYRTVNGGLQPEKFSIEKEIEQNTSVDFNISSRHCLGSTDEWLAVGDKNKELMIKTNKAQTYTVPLLEFKEVKKKFIFRIYNTACETDETTHETLFKGKIKFSFSLRGETHFRS